MGEEWVAFAIAHIAEKVKGINWGTLDFCHLEKSTPSTFVKFLEQALADKASEQYKSFYEFLFKTFVESDVEERGTITFDKFLNWALTHVAAKIREYRANGGR